MKIAETSFDKMSKKINFIFRNPESINNVKKLKYLRK